MKEAIKAIQKEIDYLEDNGYRFKLNGQLDIYEQHQKKIVELKRQLQKIEEQ